MHHDLDEVLEAFNPDPDRYRLEGWQAQDETVVDFYATDDDSHVAMFAIRLLDDGGTAWKRAWVHPEFQGQGIYTHLHRWALTQPSSVILAVGEQTEMYKDSGYEEIAPGVLEIRPEPSQRWLEGR